MKKELNYIDINRNTWNKKTDIHLKSEFYDMENFMLGNTSLNPIELELLGDLSGKRILHLQCHFGQDTIALSRLGAEVTGVDLSDKAIEEAKHIAKKLNSNTRFICCDLYDLPNHLNEEFDLVFTSYGTIGWLPDIGKWSRIVSKYLKPGGKFVFVEFHPFVWMFDDNFDKINYKYSNSEAIIEIENGTYADKNATIKEESVTWNHSLSEVINSLLQNGLELVSFKEYDYSPYNCFNNTIEFEPKKYQIEHLEDKIPMVYSIVAKKRS